MKKRMSLIKKVGIGFAGLMVVCVLANAGGTDTKETETKEVAKVEEVKKEEPKEEVKETVSKEFENALKKAYSYGTRMNMSKQGIYDQLVSEYGEGFTKEAAQYAIDNLNIDFKENALNKARSYQDKMNMSAKGVYDQLVSQYGEKFTAEEAKYAVDNLNK